MKFEIIMSANFRNMTVVLTLVLCTIASWNYASADQSSSGKYIVGYFFPRDRIAEENEIAVEKLTHINYAFANIKDGEIIEGFKNDSTNFSVLNKMKVRNPHLKILVSVGGWTWSGQFSDLSLTAESRKKFIISSINFLTRHKLDGIDLDWEFPNLEGYGNIYRPEDKKNFTYLLQEFRTALDEVGKKENKYFLLTAAVGAFDDYIANTEMEKASQYLDLINVMAYDLYESDYDKVAGHHTALYSNPNDLKNVSADAAVQKYLSLGVPADKIVLGVAFYGRAWEAATTENNGLYQKAGAVKKHVGTSFKNLKPNLENKNGFKRYWDPIARAPYLFNEEEKIFISYDDEESLKEKCIYIKEFNLKGAMFWEYQSDFENKLLQTLDDCLK